MKYSIERGNGVPAYLQLYTALREDIVSGVLPAGSRLPSKRGLAAELSTALLTVEHAYALLCDEGYVEARERRGYFVLYHATEPFSPPAAAPSVPQHTAGTGSSFPFSTFARTMRRVITDYGERLLERSPNNGCAELREALKRYLARSRGIYVDVSQIVIGSGAEYLYSLVVHLAGRDALYALEDPSYRMIRRVYEANGVRCEMLPLRIDGIDSEALWRSNADVLHVTPFHSFPSSVTASAFKRREYVRWARERGALIVEDDFDSEFTISSKAEDTLFSLEPNGSVIYLNTFTRTVAPSVRAGYMVLPRTLLNRFNACAGFYSCTVPVLDQLVLASLIDSGDFERYINRERRKRRREQDIGEKAH